MALPASGQISFNDVRVEVSQSEASSYAMSEWTWGLGRSNCSGIGIKNAPINVLSSGSRFSESSPLNLSNLSMSAWYNYDHNLYIPTEVTGTLYSHADYADQLCPTTMLPIELGTTNSTFSINISGSTTTIESIIVFYGKPWRNNADDAGGSFPASTVVVANATTTSFQYNYTYNASSGSKLYVVCFGACNV
jgi:hypothetical protein